MSKQTQRVTMKVGVIGLGKMGGPIAHNLKKTHGAIRVYDANPHVSELYAAQGFTVAKSISELSEYANVLWIMVPQSALDSVLEDLCACTELGTVLIDGGNSFYKESIRRAQELEKRHLGFLDCGTSGGLWGAHQGFSMTIGGKKEVFEQVEILFKALAQPSGSYALVGPSGAGHYVKMIHNGIEYALLESYAEGFSLLKEGAYLDLDLAKISATWLSGGVIRSWILELTREVLAQDQNLDSIEGFIGENGTGRWTVEEAQARTISVPLIKEAVAQRAWLRQTGGNYRTKLIASIRHRMGGHQIIQKACTLCTEQS